MVPGSGQRARMASAKRTARAFGAKPPSAAPAPSFGRSSPLPSPRLPSPPPSSVPTSATVLSIGPASGGPTWSTRGPSCRESPPSGDGTSGPIAARPSGCTSAMTSTGVADVSDGPPSLTEMAARPQARMNRGAPNARMLTRPAAGRLNIRSVGSTRPRYPSSTRDPGGGPAFSRVGQSPRSRRSAPGQRCKCRRWSYLGTARSAERPCHRRRRSP